MFDFQLVKCSKIFYNFFLFAKILVIQMWRETDDPKLFVCTNTFEGTAKNPTKKALKKLVKPCVKIWSTRNFAFNSDVCFITE